MIRVAIADPEESADAVTKLYFVHHALYLVYRNLLKTKERKNGITTLAWLEPGWVPMVKRGTLTNIQFFDGHIRSHIQGIKGKRKPIKNDHKTQLYGEDGPKNRAGPIDPHIAPAIANVLYDVAAQFPINNKRMK
jgi:prepilin-type processing-associated H-X9-DG protein